MHTKQGNFIKMFKGSIVTLNNKGDMCSKCSRTVIKFVVPSLWQ